MITVTRSGVRVPGIPMRRQHIFVGKGGVKPSMASLIKRLIKARAKASVSRNPVARSCGLSVSLGTTLPRCVRVTATEKSEWAGAYGEVRSEMGKWALSAT